MNNNLNEVFVKKENFTVQTNSDNNLLDTEDENNSDLPDGFVKIRNNGHFYYCMTIIGQIEGHYILPPQKCFSTSLW